MSVNESEIALFNHLFIVSLSDDCDQQLLSQTKFAHTRSSKRLFSGLLDGGLRPDDGIYVVEFCASEPGDTALLSKLASLNPWVKIVAFARSPDIDCVVEAFRAGAFDVIRADRDVSEHVDALLAADRALRDLIEKSHSAFCAARKIASLTRRERMVLDGIFVGLQNKVIAADLNLSVRTVEMFRSTMMEKLGAKTAVEAVRELILAESI